MFNDFSVDENNDLYNYLNFSLNDQHFKHNGNEKDFNNLKESLFNSHFINLQDYFGDNGKLEDTNNILNLLPERKTKVSDTNNFNLLMKQAKKKKENIKYGKKKKRDNSNSKNNTNSSTDNDPSHDKFTPDNLIRKLKANLMDSILNFLNNNLNDNSIMFLKLNKNLNENLKKDYNLILMKRTIRDIFYNEEISKLYINKKYINNNRKLIEKIEKEKVETKIIEILNMTFIEFINEIRDNHLEDFFNKIKEKEIKNNADNIEQYMYKLKQLFANYEKFFENKKGRKSKNDKLICINL